MKILITGGTGSLGRALIRKIKKLNWDIVVYSRDEGKQALYFGADRGIVRIIGDIRDLNKLDTAFRLHKPDYVIHAAALKRIDDMEFYPDECVKTNIQGSENVAVASLKNGVKKCILISTDKACQPVNVYGSSKFIAERIFTNFDYNSSSTIFNNLVVFPVPGGPKIIFLDINHYPIRPSLLFQSKLLHHMVEVYQDYK